MRVLFATPSSPGYMMPPLLGDQQVNCGPQWPDERAADGTVRSIKTPVGDYDLGAIVAQLPADQRPDVVVCLVDASWRHTPRNLTAVKCPRVLLVADTHHLRSPVVGMMRYMASEPYHRMALLYDRHHAALFHAAGFRDLAWLPGLTFPHADAAVAAARQKIRERRVAFVGQTGPLHPRRTQLLETLTQARLPVVAQPLRQAEALAFYGASAVGFNASLNGDLNLRVFEILASGAALITDRLSPAAGLASLFSDGEELVTYRDEAQLTDVTKKLLAQPEAARAIGAAGARWFDTHWNEAKRRAAFETFVNNGTTPEMFAFNAAERATVFFGGDTDRLLQAAMIFEGAQEEHRTQRSIRIAHDATTPPELVGLFGALPRAELLAVNTGATGDDRKAGLMIFGREHVEAVAASSAERLWCWDAAPADFATLAERLQETGFSLVSRDVALFCREISGVTPAAPAAAAPTRSNDLAQARVLFRQGNLPAAFALARAVLEREPRSIDARVLLGELALRRRDGAPLAEKLFRQALAASPGKVEIELLLAEAVLAGGDVAGAAQVFLRVLKTRPHELGALLGIARVRAAEKWPSLAEGALRDAVRHHPNAPEAARALGDFLKRSDRLWEALAWHQRAQGCADPVPLLDPTVRPVRVAFILQNPQGWTSLESVWRAMQSDAAFESFVIAAPYQHPYPPEGGPEAIYGFLEKQGVPFTRWNQFPLERGFADVVFLQNPYDVTRPAPLHVANILRLVPRIAYVPYGLEIGGGERNNTMVMNMPLQQLAWLVCARSERQRQAYSTICDVGNAHVAVTGHAKLDALRELAAVDARALEAFAAGRKLIGWNPHFDLRPKAGSRFGEGFSTFLRWWEVMLAEFTRRSDLALVMRPHPLFFGTLVSRRIWTQAQVDEFLGRVTTSGNIRIDRDASYLPLFARADAMISDASSFVLEFAATGKPLLYLHNPDGPQLNDDGEFVRDCLYTAETEAEIGTFLDHVSMGADPRREVRRARFPEFMHVPPEGSGEAVKRAVLERIARESAATTSDALLAV